VIDLPKAEVEKLRLRDVPLFVVTLPTLPIQIMMQLPPFSIVTGVLQAVKMRKAQIKIWNKYVDMKAGKLRPHSCHCENCDGTCR